MEILVAVALGVVASFFIKAVFMPELKVVTGITLGAAGGLAAYLLSTAVSESVYQYVATIGTATLVVGLLWMVMRQFGKTA